ncbi:MAG: VacB/RNase II family 3'-5' exoribonuclease [Lentisphaeria bacterium]|nr:VacB/RNase II family 3'-5' exoribonuclease [Lentisphaeria bacterium]
MSKNRHQKKKRLLRIADRKYERQLARAGKFVVGKLKMTHSGYGFVELAPADRITEKAEDIFIPIPKLNGALDGDIVKVQLLPGRREFSNDTANRGETGRIVDVIERSRVAFVGEVLPGGVVRPLNTRLPADIKLLGSRKGAQKGDLVKVRGPEMLNGEWRGTISSVIGRTGILEAELDAVMAEYDIPAPYSEEENAAAMEITPRDIDRVKLPKLFVITIDPDDAKDFDDALSITPCKEDKDLVELGVHIADVAAFIAPQTRFDSNAARRGFSCYLPGRTLPMLPPGLTAKISMQAGTPSLAHSVFLTVNKKSGEILSARREHTLVTIAHRLNYDEVQEFADKGTVPENWTPKVKKCVKDLLKLTSVMRKFRAEKEEFIELPLPEVRVRCDEKKNEIQGIESRISRPSEQLVEECMLAANSAVGAELVKKGVAGVFRIHDEPEFDKLCEFSEMAGEFGFITGDLTSRKVCNEFVRSLPDNPKREVILSLLLRSFPRAGYAAKPLLHYALGKTAYAHFTSPIRRYADLTVHQQLWNLDKKSRTRRVETMEKVAEKCTELEEMVDEASFAASDRLKLRILEEELNRGELKIYEGVIAKVITAGLQVAIEELGLYGFVPVDALPGNRRRGKFTLYGERNSSSNFKLGDYIYLRLAGIDFARGSALFVPAGR